MKMSVFYTYDSRCLSTIGEPIEKSELSYRRVNLGTIATVQYTHFESNVFHLLINRMDQIDECKEYDIRKLHNNAP